MTLLDYFRHHVGNGVPTMLPERKAEETDRRINAMSNVELLAWIGDYMNRSEQ